MHCPRAGSTLWGVRWCSTGQKPFRTWQAHGSRWGSTTQFFIVAFPPSSLKAAKTHTWLSKPEAVRNQGRGQGIHEKRETQQCWVEDAGSLHGISDSCSNGRTLRDPLDLKPISSFSTLWHLWLWPLKAATKSYTAKYQPQELRTLSRPGAGHTC